MDVEEIKKMTVADLKKELKARNLHVTGNKSELMQRLTEHILNSEERQILDASDNVDESLLEGIHEDEVLGLSTTSFYTAPSDSPAVGATPSTATKYKIPLKKDTPTIPAAKISKPVTLSKLVSNDEAKSPAPASAPANEDRKPETEGTVAKKIHLKTSSTDSTEPKESRKLSSTDPEQQRIERAKKFDVPLSETDRKKLRAERFGIPASNSGSKTLAASANGGSKTSAASVIGSFTDPEVLAKRAQRFGVPVVATSKSTATASAANPADGVKLKERAERFGLSKQQATGTVTPDTSGDEQEKALKRKLRFTGGDTDEKKKARAERFGVSVTSK